MTEIREIMKKFKDMLVYSHMATWPHKIQIFVGEIEQAIDKAEAEIGVMQRQHKGSQDALKKVMAECAEDTKRLDWIDENLKKIDTINVCAFGGSLYLSILEDDLEEIEADNIRDLIDKANNADNNL